MVNGTPVPRRRHPAYSAHTPWYGRVRWWRPSRRDRGPDAIDIAVAAVSFAAFTVPGALRRADGSGPGGYGSTAHVLLFGALAVAPLIVRRRWPLSVLAGVAVVHCVAALVGVRFTPFVSNAGPAMAVAVLTVADRHPRRTSLLTCTAATAATAIAAAVGLYLHPDQDQDAVQILIAAPAWLLGDALRTRRGYRHRLALEGQRQTAERERRIRAEERLQVSRDVHDVVSHTLSMIAVRSGVARLLLDERPDEARDALTAIETTSRSALDEVRRVLRHTRQEAGETAWGAAPKAWGVAADRGGEPTLADLGPMVAGLRDAGLELSYRSTGRPRSYPRVLETSAYRIVQEALTNVVKHAGATCAQVEVHHGQRELVISVVDDGRPHQHAGAALSPGGSTSSSGAAARPDGGSGLGLIGMRERAELFDGTLSAGPREEGGFAVVVHLPIEHDVDDEPDVDAADQVDAGYPVDDD
jgi:signal transduction histidine kinase